MARKGDGLVKRSNTWWLDARISGKRYQVMLGKGISRTVAGEIAQVKRGEFLKGEAGIGAKKKRDLTFEQASEMFLAWAKTNKRPRTATFYEQCLSKLSGVFGKKKLSEIAPFHLEAYKTQRKKEGAPVRCNRELAALKAMYNRLGMGKKGLKKYDGPNPVKDVEFLEESKGKLRFLEPDEEAALLKECGEPLRTIALVGIYTGFRVASELLTLRWGSIDFSRNLITVGAGYAKNREERSVPMNSRLREALEAHRDHSTKTAPEEHVFLAWKGPRKGEPLRSIRTALETAAGKAKIAGVTPHVLRHTFASRLVMAGVDLRTVQELGGWKELAMVQRYSHLSPAHKAEAVERMLVSTDTPAVAERKAR